MSAPPTQELRIAREIYLAMKRCSGALVQGDPADSKKTLIDGMFDLCQISTRVLKIIQTADDAIGRNSQTARKTCS